MERGTTGSVKTDLAAIVPGVAANVSFDDSLTGPIQVDSIIAVIFIHVAAVEARTVLVADSIPVVHEVVIPYLNYGTSTNPFISILDGKTDDLRIRPGCFGDRDRHSAICV